MFGPLIMPRLLVEVWLLSEQSSKAGSGSLTTVPTPLGSGDWTTDGSLTGLPVLQFTAWMPWVWPEIRLSAPGVDGPKTVL
jgi:hypothetical protein